MEIENKMTKEMKKEKEIVLLKDFKQWERIMAEYRCGDIFECPKCKSSVVCISEDYVKNNIMNSMDDNKPNEYGYKKLVLECGNCQHIDLLIKFLQIVKRKEFTPYGEEVISPSPYKPRGIIPKPFRPQYKYPDDLWRTTKTMRISKQ